jgi:hypothetical protein
LDALNATSGGKRTAEVAFHEHESVVPMPNARLCVVKPVSQLQIDGNSLATVIAEWISVFLEVPIILAHMVLVIPFGCRC